MGTKYASDIQKIPTGDFAKVGQVKVAAKDGSTSYISSSDLKDKVKKEFQGGKSEYTFQQKVKDDWKLGGSNSQVDKRNKLIKLVSGGSNVKAGSSGLNARQEARIERRTKIARGNRMIDRLNEQRQSLGKNEKVASRTDKRLNRALESGGVKTGREQLNIEDRRQISRGGILADQQKNENAQAGNVTKVNFASQGPQAAGPASAPEATALTGALGVKKADSPLGGGKLPTGSGPHSGGGPSPGGGHIPLSKASGF